MPTHAAQSLKPLAVLVCLAAGPAASAQSLDTTGATFNTGYGRSSGQENRPIVVSNYGVRDANGNMVVIDGVIQNAGSSSYSASSAGASASASASGSFTGGVGGASAGSTAIGNNLTVVTQGDYNTVIVNSTQINNGKITAGATVQAPASSTSNTSGGASNAQ
jgi:holdfast attachment protein HfaA